MKAVVFVSTLVLATLALSCTPSIDRAAQADLDRRLAAIQPSSRQVPAPAAATPQPLAVGQWIMLRQIDKENRPSLSTYKIVGAEADAFWLEVTTDSYFGSSGSKILVALGDRTEPSRFEIRRAFTRYHGRSTVAVAGYSTTSEVWWHPEVPINGVVKTVGVGEPTATELVDFGREGAQSTF